MEFDQLFTAIQGIMRSHQNGSVVRFHKIAKDNDKISHKIVESLKALITELSLKDEYLRKINLFLMINTDFPSIQLLEDDSNCWHLLGCLPKLSTFLYFRIVTALKFGVFIGETIRLAPPFIALELLQVINENLSSSHPDLVVSFIGNVYESTFFRIIHLQRDSGCLSVILQKFVKLFQNIISNDLKLLVAADKPYTNEERYIYFGYITRMLLSVLKNSIENFNSKSIEHTKHIYDFTVEYNYTKLGECKRVINWTNHCLTLLVSKCAEAIKCITVDMFMAWCEVEVKDSVNKTLQTAIREHAYLCKEQLKSIIHMKDKICNFELLDSSLSNIAIQPVTEDDEIERADAETIIVNLLNPKRTQTKWLKGLMCVPGIFQSPKYMKVIQDNAHLFDLEIAKVLLDNLCNFLSTSQCPRNFYEVAKNLFFHCIKTMPLSVQLELLSYYFHSKGNSKALQRENFDQSLVVALNKISSIGGDNDEMYSDFVMFCFENCEVFVQTLLRDCLSSDLKADLLIDLLMHITPLANVSCSASALSLTLGASVHLMDTVVSSLKKNKDNFLQLVQKLCVLGLIEGDVLFPAHVLPRLEKSLNDNDMESIVFFMDALFVYVNVKSVPSNSAALLAFLAKAFDSLRPGITNFTTERMIASSKLSDFINKLTKNVVDSKTDQDSEILWLQEKVLPLKPITRINFRILWTKWNQDMPGVPFWAQEGLGLKEHLINVSQEDRRDIVTKTLKVLPILTYSDWLLLGSLDKADISLLVSTIDALVDSILVSFQVPFLMKNIHIINNMLINFSQFIWEKVIPRLSNKDEETRILKNKIFNLQEMIPFDLQKTRRPQLQLLLQSLNDDEKKINQY